MSETKVYDQINEQLYILGRTIASGFERIFTTVPFATQVCGSSQNKAVVANDMPNANRSLESENGCKQQMLHAVYLNKWNNDFGALCRMVLHSHSFANQNSGVHDSPFGFAHETECMA